MNRKLIVKLLSLVLIFVFTITIFGCRDLSTTKTTETNVITNSTTSKTIETTTEDPISTTILITYRVSWYNYDGTLLQVTSAEKGKMPTYTGQMPSKSSNLIVPYVFAGWNPDVRPATKDTSYYARFELGLKGYQSLDNYNYQISNDKITINSPKSRDIKVLALLDEYEFDEEETYVISTIDSSAFSGCESLTYVFLNNGVKTIKSNAFSNCTKLELVVLPKTVTSIENKAFDNCSKLECIYYQGSRGEYAGISGKNNINKTVYYYSEQQPAESSNYWHFVDGYPTIW